MYEFFKQELIWTILLKKLHEIHTGLHSDLIKAHNNINGQKLYTVFLNWKKKLLIYGSICSNLSNARRAVKSALCRSKNVADEIEVWRLFLSIASFSYIDLRFYNHFTSAFLNSQLYFLTDFNFLAMSTRSKWWSFKFGRFNHASNATIAQIPPSAWKSLQTYGQGIFRLLFLDRIFMLNFLLFSCNSFSRMKITQVFS